MYDDPYLMEDGIRGRRVEPRENQGIEGRGVQGVRERDVGLNTIKMGLPIFKGESDPEDFLAWESACKRVFQVNDLMEEKKSCYAIAHFEGYATT